MKANEAPDKIYRTTLYLDNDKGETKWKRQPVAGAENIEYTRTDAFIEKVYEFLKNYAFTDDENNVHLPTLLHDFLKDIRTL